MVDVEPGADVDVDTMEEATVDEEGTNVDGMTRVVVAPGVVDDAEPPPASSPPPPQLADRRANSNTVAVLAAAEVGTGGKCRSLLMGELLFRWGGPAAGPGGRCHGECRSEVPRKFRATPEPGPTRIRIHQNRTQRALPSGRK